MIVVGVDPGARNTGVVAVDTAQRTTAAGWTAAPLLLAHATVLREKTEPLCDVSQEYLHRLQHAVATAVSEHQATVLAIEGVRPPGGFANGRRQPLDPAAIIATGIVLGSLLGRRWGVGGDVELVVVPPGRNGSQVLASYPAPLAGRPGGRGQDARRHERSAYDVARSAPALLRLQAARGSVYAG